MWTLFSSLLGFGTSFLPKVMDYFQDKQDKAHELDMMDKNLESQKVLGAQRLEMTHVEADIRGEEALLKHDAKIVGKASRGIINLAASVRPMIAYLLFIEFFVLTFLLAFDQIDKNLYETIWNEPMQMVFAAVVSFYFGSRTFNRKGHS